MSDERHILAATAARVFADGAGDWAAIVDAGFPLLFVPAARGGYDGGWSDAFVVLARAGADGLAQPLGEAMLATHLLASAGLDLPAGRIGIASANLVGAPDRVDVFASSVPWGRDLDALVTVAAFDARPYVVAVPLAPGAVVVRGENTADEPRDDIVVRDVAPIAAAPLVTTPDLDALGGLMRAAQMAGALDALVAMTVQYAKDRKQFGRSIGAFQAVQQQIVVLAEEAAAVSCAVQSACLAADAGPAGFEIACAKLRADQAVGVASAIAHAVHGAIGFTREHRLHRMTSRLWAWRSEHGNDRFWAERIGAEVVAAGADRFWPDLTTH